MQPTGLPLQSSPDAGALVVWVPAVVLLFLVAVAYVEHLWHRELVEVDELDPEIVRGRAWSMVLAAGVLLGVLAVGLAVSFLVVVNFDLTGLAGRTAWILGTLVSLAIGLGFVWWLARPFEASTPAPAASSTDVPARRDAPPESAGRDAAPDAQDHDAHRTPDTGPGAR